MVLALRAARKSFHPNTTGMVGTALLAKKLDTYAQPIKDDSYSDASWARFDILLDALTKKAIKMSRFPDGAALPTYKIGMVGREKSETAMNAPSLIRFLPLARRSEGFERLVELVRIVE